MPTIQYKLYDITIIGWCRRFCIFLFHFTQSRRCYRCIYHYAPDNAYVSVNQLLTKSHTVVKPRREPCGVMDDIKYAKSQFQQTSDRYIIARVVLLCINILSLYYGMIHDNWVMKITRARCQLVISQILIFVPCVYGNNWLTHCGLVTTYGVLNGTKPLPGLMLAYREIRSESI